jgi:hypothetical protein
MSAIFTSAFTLGITTAIHAVADVVVCPAIVARALLLVGRCGIPGGIIFGIILIPLHHHISVLRGLPSLHLSVKGSLGHYTWVVSLEGSGSFSLTNY